MKHEIKIDYELLNRYFNDACSNTEKEAVKSWFEDAAAEKKLSVVLKQHWSEIGLKQPEMQKATERILDKIHHQIHIESYNKSEKQITLKRALSLYSKVAAVLLIPLLVYSLLWTSRDVKDTRALLPNQKDAYAEIVAPPGARTHFELPDGSTGWLNSGSKLKFPVKFTGTERVLHLTGEAWFSVVKNPDVPFVVSTLNVDVVAVGTKFNVQAYPDSKSVDVTLESGKVIVQRRVKNKLKLIAELEPGEQISVLKQGGKLEKVKEIEPERYTSWREGKLIMRNEKMVDVIKKLERWYNVKIEVKDSEIKDYKYRATFQDETIDEILRLLKLTSPIDYRVKKRVMLKDGTYAKREIVLFLKK